MTIKRSSNSEYTKVLNMRHFCIIHGWDYSNIPVVDRKMLFGHHGYTFDEMVKYYSWAFRRLGLELLELIVDKDGTVFGTAFYNAAIKVNKGNMKGDNQPEYTSIREEFSILLQKMRANGFEFKYLLNRYMDNEYFIKRRKHKRSQTRSF